MKHDFAAKLASITASALDKTELQGIVDVLKDIANAVDASGCILWLTDPWTDSERHPERLYIFARWLSDEINLPLRELPFENSINGLALSEKRTQNIENMESDPRTYKGDDSIKKAKLTSMCVVPIKFNSNKFNATLSVYRRKKIKPFKPAEQKFIEQIANIISPLNRAIRDKARYLLLTKITRILYEAEQNAKLNNDNPKEMLDGLQKVCVEIANSFQCIETSLFLENRFEAEKQYKLVASSYLEWTDEKQLYFPDKTEGLTGWVLEKKSPVNIFNLAYFDKDISLIRKEYEDIQWNDSLHIEPIARKQLRFSEGNPLPISYMAVPISDNKPLLGVIRCCAAKEDPWFFSDGQLEILLSVATQIHRFWHDWLQYLEDIEENKLWTDFVESVQKLNTEVQESFYRSDVNEQRLFDQITDLCKNFVGDAEIIETDDKVREIFSAQSQNSAWKAIASETVSKEKNDLLFSIGIAGDFIGRLLHIQNHSSKEFSPNAKRMAELLAQQLSLYISLWRSEQKQKQVFEDFGHQLRGPVHHMSARVNGLIQSIRYRQWHKFDEENVKEIVNQSLMLRSIARKAKRTANNAGVFKDLSSLGRLTLSQMKIIKLNTNIAIKMLDESAKDAEYLLEDYRQIKFYLNRESFSRLTNIEVRVDFDLLEQAVNCLFDNAGKYSFTETTVRIKGGEEIRNNHRYFYISVSNVGLEIKQDEIPRLKIRYIRGDLARAVTGEGSGIGLWVVDHMMRAHKGELEILQTDKRGLTEIRLWFPIIS